eukprot:31532-Pelagococcus_subviridis.AAC.30
MTQHAVEFRRAAPSRRVRSVAIGVGDAIDPGMDRSKRVVASAETRGRADGASPPRGRGRGPGREDGDARDRALHPLARPGRYRGATARAGVGPDASSDTFFHALRGPDAVGTAEIAKQV